MEAVKREKPDLLVLGARGHSALERILLGSVSESVAFQAACSVLVLRPNEEKEESDEQSRPPRIVLAYDDSKHAQAAAAELTRPKWPSSTELDVLMVETEPASFLELGFPVPMASMEIWQQDSKAKLNAQCEVLAESFPKVSPTLMRGHHIGDAIVRHAEAENSDLIVLGDSGHGSFERILLGSTTRYVLRNANCSVWISKSLSQAAQNSPELASQESKAQSSQGGVDLSLEHA